MLVVHAEDYNGKEADKFKVLHCEEWCHSTACVELTGDTLSFECGKCPATAECHPGVEDFKEAATERRSRRDRRRARRARKNGTGTGHSKQW